MAYRFTNTDKWSDSWFYGLNNLEKLLFMYLCDNCDIAGFVEINLLKWCSDFRVKESEIKGALKGLNRGLKYSLDGRIIFIRNFIKHQKNQDLNRNNKAHLGIIKRLEENLNNFGLEEVNQYFTITSQAPTKGLPRGTGIGNSNILYNIDNKEEEILNKELIELKEDIYPFEDFWNDYDKKVGEKEKIKKKYEKLKDEEKKKIKAFIPRYKQSQPEKQYRKNPETFLNNKSWNDEIITKSNNNQIKPQKGATINDLQNIYNEIIYGDENRRDNSPDGNAKMLPSG